MNPRTFLWKHNSVNINKKINYVGGNLDLSGSGDTIRGHELSWAENQLWRKVNWEKIQFKLILGQNYALIPNLNPEYFYDLNLWSYWPILVWAIGPQSGKSGFYIYLMKYVPD